ncbi:MAG: hypothetical protein GXP62_12030 [Oligoflexia bacterium]|nr:hypothetical protein [Oligoflexia bacterium]
MRSISKGDEPACVASLRREMRRAQQETGRQPVADDWNLGDCAQPVRQALCVEQQGLCAYCMQRIKPHGYRSELHTRGGMKVEHFEDRATHPERMYDWDNLLGVCGGEFRGSAGLVEHCDTSRGSQPLCVNPATTSPPCPEDAFTFEKRPPDGIANGQGLWIHPTDPAYQRDIDRLNLNADHLVYNRWSVLHELGKRLSACGDEASRRKFLRRRFVAAATPGRHGLLPFAPLVADYVERKMRVKGMAP